MARFSTSTVDPLALPTIPCRTRSLTVSPPPPHPPGSCSFKKRKPEELVHREAAAAARIPLIRRFSGGGTVLLGPGCVWATLVGGEEHLPAEVAGRGPRPLMEWTERVWGPVFGRIGDFQLREHGKGGREIFCFFLCLGISFLFFSSSRKAVKEEDIFFPSLFRIEHPSFVDHSATKTKQNKTDYAFGDLKFGGNAQALSKKRWLHHTSLLWSLDHRRMTEMLKQPVRAPDYRKGRAHGLFLTSLEAQNELAREKRGNGGGQGRRGGEQASGSDPFFFESRRHFVDALAPAVAAVGGFEVVPTTLEEAEGLVEGVEHHRSTVVLE